MGYYINPPDMTKEQFLEKHGQPLSNPAEFDFAGDALPVCLVDNTAMGFTAAGICYDPRERDVFILPDGRPKKWFSVSKELLKPWYSK